jgi:hypothetical protein
MTIATSATYVYTAWTKLETHKMLILAKKYNHDWEMISFKLRTRSKAQCYGRYKRIVDLVNPEDEENISMLSV